MTDDTEELEWPDRMYLLHPSVKTFGDMITTPERREYVRADRIEALVRERDAAWNAAIQAAADAMLPTITDFRGSWYEPALKAARGRILALVKP